MMPKLVKPKPRKPQVKRVKLGAPVPVIMIIPSDQDHAEEIVKHLNAWLRAKGKAIAAFFH